MTNSKQVTPFWNTVRAHAAGHVIGAIVFASLALGVGLVLGGFVSPDRCSAPVELWARL